MSEAVYDKDVAPELLRLGRICAANGMHLVAHVEYEPGCGAYTASIDPGASFATKLVHLAAKCDGNIEWSGDIEAMRHVERGYHDGLKHLAKLNAAKAAFNARMRASRDRRLLEKLHRSLIEEVERRGMPTEEAPHDPGPTLADRVKLLEMQVCELRSRGSMR